MNFRRYSLGVLLANLAVILWGAYVRASGSGAGCGSHWPDCNGEVIPRAPELKTLIEFTHRATSGLALISTVVLAVWAFVAFAKGHRVRRAAGASLFFMLTEAAVGAGLVLFKLVAHNDTLARAMFMGVHLLNTFLLVGALTLTVFFAFGGEAPRFQGRGAVAGLSGGALLMLLVLGVSGAITALGDTLFPAVSLLDGLQSDFAPTAHLFVRLRVWHPVLAVTAGVVVTVVAFLIAQRRPTVLVRQTATLLGALFLTQLGAGVMNLVFLAPIPIQLLHLLLADGVWMALVVLSAAALAPEPAPLPAVVLAVPA